MRLEELVRLVPSRGRAVADDRSICNRTQFAGGHRLVRPSIPPGLQSSGPHTVEYIALRGKGTRIGVFPESRWAQPRIGNGKPRQGRELCSKKGRGCRGSWLDREALTTSKLSCHGCGG